MLSTREVAKKLKLGARTLSRYLQTGKLPTPKTLTVGKMTVHLWTEEEIEKARAMLPKIANGRKTRYQKKHSAVSNQHSAKAKSRKKPKKR